MPVAKLKCKYCKEYTPREQLIVTPSGKFCNDNCMMTWIKEEQEKRRLKAIKKAYSAGGRKKGKSRNDCENDLRTRKKAAKEACHAYIRERDRGLSCACCDRPLGENYQAGHYLPSGNNPLVRYHEDNIHAQRIDCNYFKGGDSGMYRVKLIEKIGLERVERIESMQGGTVKRTPQDYKEIEIYYKEKLKALRETSDQLSD